MFHKEAPIEPHRVFYVVTMIADGVFRSAGRWDLIVEIID